MLKMDCQAPSRSLCSVNNSHDNLEMEDTELALPNELWAHIFSYVDPVARPYLSPVPLTQKKEALRGRF